MTMPEHTEHPDTLYRAAQEGSMTIEFALIFLLLFFIVFAMLNLGMIFAAQQSINYASQESSRSILTFYPPGHFTPKEIQNKKAERALKLAQEQTNWINTLAQEINGTTSNIVHITICGADQPLAKNNDALHCDLTPVLNKHEIAVKIEYDYGQFPLIPSLGLLSLYELAFSQLKLNNTQRIRTSEVW